MVVAAKLLIGRFFDKLGLITTLLIISAGSLVSFPFLMNANLVLPAILYAVFTGLGSTAITVTPAYITGAIYSINHSYGLVLNVLIVLCTICIIFHCC